MGNVQVCNLQVRYKPGRGAAVSGAPITDPSDFMEAILKSEFTDFQQIYANATAD